MNEFRYDVVTTGGGPAGMAAAVSAKKNGAKRVLIIERDKELGGILQQCIHNGFGLRKFKKELTDLNVKFRQVDHVADAIADADVIYMEPVVQPDYTKARQEAEGDKGLTPSNYKVTRELLRDKAKSDAIILHSLPRQDELPSDVDGTRHARYWIEAFNGVVMRMALLASVLGAVE